jgi:MFS transporter, ENTS family, enterobactin (siderophore) exporter
MLVEDDVAVARPQVLASAADGAVTARRASLLREADYLAVLVGQGVSSLGDAASFIALPLLVLLLTGSGLLMGVVGILETAPDLIFGLPAGAFADRWDRKRVMIVADAGRAMLTALIPLSVLLGWPTMTVILLVVGPVNVLRVFFAAAENASIPALAGRDRLAAGSGYLEAVYSLGYILGPAVAGFLITIVGPGPTLALDALSFVVSAASILLVRRRLRAPVREPGTANLRGELAEGVRFAWHHPVLRPAIGYLATFNLATAAFVPALTYCLVRERGLDAVGLGTMLSIWAVGTLIGAVASARAKNGRLGVRLLAGGLVFGACLAAAGAIPALALFAVLGFVVGAAYSVVAVAYVTLRAANTPDALLGRVVSLARMITVGVQPVGMLAGGLLIDAIGGGLTLVAMGGAVLVGTLGFGVVRSVRTAVVELA